MWSNAAQPWKETRAQIIYWCNLCFMQLPDIRHMRKVGKKTVWSQYFSCHWDDIYFQPLFMMAPEAHFALGWEGNI